MYRVLIFVLLSLTCFAQDFSKHFNKYPNSGIVIYDMNNDKYYYHNKDHCEKGYIPASTFKIPNTIIGLETGVIPDTNFVIKWDGKDYGREIWNRDHTIGTAFRNSALWFYEYISDKAGKEKMQKYVDMFGYGNKKISSTKPAFWLYGDLRISPVEQVKFMNKLFNYKFAVSKKNIELLKNISIVNKTKNYTLHAKTGMALDSNIYTGWYVGYLEENNNKYFFALNLVTEDDSTIWDDRMSITKACLKDLGLMSHN